ncbi:MAG TPA: hypothetical protein VES20_01865 [Bryobacteraceae bacterium]|nr:hypothetical protein [Bryobacteraceae bacterium]
MLHLDMSELAHNPEIQQLAEETAVAKLANALIEKLPEEQSTSMHVPADYHACWRATRRWAASRDRITPAKSLAFYRECRGGEI